MSADASAYEVLGVDPSADDAEIDRAYRRLIKEHHPDREGGDSGRAAEIIRAYRELRGDWGRKDHPIEFNENWLEEGRASRAWIILAALLALATVVLLLVQGPLAPLAESFAAPGVATSRKATAPVAGRMDQPLHADAINEAVRDAVRLARTSDQMKLASESRECHHLLRTSPSLMQLDRCAAFDDAVVQLQDRDPLRDQGPFSELAVTGRIWSGASALSDDSVAIDARLDRIRLSVEQALVVLQPGAAAKKKS